MVVRIIIKETLSGKCLCYLKWQQIFSAQAKQNETPDKIGNFSNNAIRRSCRSLSAHTNSGTFAIPALQNTAIFPFRSTPYHSISIIDNSSDSILDIW